MKFRFCDDDLTEICMISGTHAYDRNRGRIKLLIVVIFCVHLIVSADRTLTMYRSVQGFD